MKDDEIRKDYENEWLLNDLRVNCRLSARKHISQADLAKTE